MRRERAERSREGRHRHRRAGGAPGAGAARPRVTCGEVRAREDAEGGGSARLRGGKRRRGEGRGGQRRATRRAKGNITRVHLRVIRGTARVRRGWGNARHRGRGFAARAHLRDDRERVVLPRREGVCAARGSVARREGRSLFPPRWQHRPRPSHEMSREDPTASSHTQLARRLISVL